MKTYLSQIKINYYLLLIILPFFTYTISCTKKEAEPVKQENFSSRTPQNTYEFVEGIKQILSNLNTQSVFNSKTCSQYIFEYTDAIYQKPTDYFIPKSESEKQLLISQRDELINDLFRIKVTLRKKLKDFEEEKTISDECIKAIRRGIRYARFSEEFLIEYLQSQNFYKDYTNKIFEKKFPFTVSNPDYPDFKIQAGDVMLVRGKAYVSAMIARMGDEEAQFSHLAIVGSDNKNNLYVVESLIQQGVITTPLQKWLNQEESRVVLFRQSDKELAKKAALAIYNKASEHLKKGSAIKYDFKMDYNDHSEIFCAEVISWAYELASDNQYKIPRYMTHVSKFKNTNYLKELGLTSDVLFEPADIEVDTRFDLIAESKFMPLTRQVRLQDSVMTSVYNWMIQKGYDFHTNVEINVKGFLAKIIRQFGLIKDKIPAYMPIKTINTTLKFEAVATTLEKNIYEKEKEFFKTHGYSLAFKDMLKINEDFRSLDCSKHQAYLKENVIPKDAPFEKDPSIFHWFFYSKNKGCE